MSEDSEEEQWMDEENEPSEPPTKQQPPKPAVDVFQDQEIAKLKETMDPSTMTTTLALLDSLFAFTSKEYFISLLGLFFGGSDHQAQVKVLQEIKPKSSLCGKSLNHADIFWMCEDCSKIGNCTCYCCECFEAERHAGHKYSFQVGNVGCCDCGDEASLKPESFCKLHRKNATAAADFDLLPDYQKIYSPMVLMHIMDHLHEKIAKATPGQSTHEAALETSLALQFLFAIFKASPLLHQMIADSLRLEFRGHLTLHSCSSDVKGEQNKEHECRCSVLENIMKVLLRLHGETNISELFAELCKVIHEFGLCFLKAYWRNHKYILDLAGDRKVNPDFLDKVMWQVIVVDQEVVDIMPGYVEHCISSLEWATEKLIVHGGKINDSEMCMCMNMCYDYQYFYNKEGLLSDFLLQKTDFIPRYMECMRKLQYIGHVSQMKAHVLFEETGISSLLPKAIYFLLEMFFFTIRGYNFDSESVNKMLFSNVFRCLEADFADSSNKSLVNSQNIPLLRVLSVLIVRLAHKFEAAAPEELLARMQLLVGGVSMGSLRPLLEYALKRTLRALGFVCELNAGCWMYFGSNAEQVTRFVQEIRKESIVYVDISLVQILLKLLSEKAVDLFALFEKGMMVPMLDPSQSPLPHLRYNPGDSSAGLETTEQIISMLRGHEAAPVSVPIPGAAEGGEVDEEKVNKTFREKATSLAAQGMLMMGNCLFNDTAKVSVFLKSSIKGYKLPAPEELRGTIEYVIKKEATNIILLSEEKTRPYENFSLDNLMDMFPSYLKVNEALEILKGFFREIRAAKGQLGYQVSPQFLSYVNMLNMCNNRFLGNCESNLKCIAKMLALPALDVFAEGVLDKGLRTDKVVLIRKIAENGASVRELLGLLANSKEYVTHCVCLRVLYEVSQYCSAQWSPEAKEKLFAEISASAHKLLDPVYSPSIERIRTFLFATATTPSTNHSPAEVPVSSGNKSELTRERQRKIAADFLKKQGDFVKKHADELASLGPKESAGESCSYCHESVNFLEFAAKPFGYLCLLTMAGVYNKAHIDTAQELMERCMKIGTGKEEIKGRQYPLVNTCSHMMHYKCYEEFVKQNSHHHETANTCPLCKYPFNNLLPALQTPLASAQELCLDTIFSFTATVSRGHSESSLIPDVIKHFLRYLEGSAKSVDLNPLHAVLSAKQKPYRHMLNCVLSLLKPGDFENVPHSDAESLMTKDCAEELLREMMRCRIAKIGTEGTGVGKKMHEDMKEKIGGLLKEYITQAVIKHLLIDKEWKDFVGKGEEFAADFQATAKAHSADINASIVSFLSKTILFESVFEDWDYTDPSVDKLRNIVSSTFSPEVTIEKFCTQILGISPASSELSLDPLTLERVKEAILGFGKITAGIIEEGHGTRVEFCMLTTPLSFKLISLPQSYDQVFAKFYTKNCKKCTAKINSKCLCLFCGEVVCAGANCCRQMVAVNGNVKMRGELTQHAAECGSGIGLFLHIYRGSLILQSDLLGVETNSIYSNSYGEDVSVFCNPAYVPFNSGDLAKYKLDAVKYAFYRDLLAMGKEKYEIWQERLLGRPVINEGV